MVRTWYQQKPGKLQHIAGRYRERERERERIEKENILKERERERKCKKDMFCIHIDNYIFLKLSYYLFLSII